MWALIMQNVINKNLQEQLEEIAENYPELVFKNNGYEYLPKEVQTRLKDKIEKINNLLRPHIGGYSHFNNFTPNKEGKLRVRFQYDWNYGEKFTGGFIGVGYLLLSEVEHKEMYKEIICRELDITEEQYVKIFNKLYDIHFLTLYEKTKDELKELFKQEL